MKAQFKARSIFNLHGPNHEATGTITGDLCRRIPVFDIFPTHILHQNFFLIEPMNNFHHIVIRLLMCAVISSAYQPAFGLDDATPQSDVSKSDLSQAFEEIGRAHV